MFTGIVEAIGTVTAVGEGTLTIAVPELNDLETGGSVSVNGACLTVTKALEQAFMVDVVPETFRRTNLGGLDVASLVNLERPVAATGRLDGHIVQGHVDGTATVVGLTPEGRSTVIEMELPSNLSRYIVEKGFVAVDGVSLTIVDCADDRFSVAVIPHTGAVTTLGDSQAGREVNIEIDILAKYVERLISNRT